MNTNNFSCVWYFVFVEWSSVNSNSVIDKHMAITLSTEQIIVSSVYRLNVLKLPEPKVQASLSNHLLFVVRPFVHASACPSVCL